MTLPRKPRVGLGVLAWLLALLVVATGCTASKADSEWRQIAVDRSGAIQVLMPAGGPAGHPLLFEELQRSFAERKLTATFNTAANAAEQLTQWTKARNSGAQTLVVAPMDQHLMRPMLIQAVKDGRTVVCVGARPIAKGMCTLFVGWDDFAGGWDQAQALLAALRTAKPGLDRPWHVEVFGLDKGIKSAEMRHHGSLDSLKPHRPDPEVTIKTGQTSYVQVAIPGSNPGALRRHLATTIEATYLNQPLEGLVLPDDQFIGAALNAIDQAGIARPLIVSSGATSTGITALAKGEIVATQYADPHWLADEVARALATLRAGEPLEISPRRMRDMDLVKTPSLLLTPVTVTKQNAPETLRHAPQLLALVKAR